uniref:DET1- and DDB1-associated protein 1 n=1 Tax=Panstrongylus lignarius TaxID=156445 RepID=A0A224Y1P8_9HEMI
MSVIAEFMHGLPSYNKENFSKFTAGYRTNKRSTVYLPTKDQPSEQVIVTEKTNILLRYLNKKWAEKEEDASKRKRTTDTTNSQGSPKKKRRLDESP